MPEEGQVTDVSRPKEEGSGRPAPALPAELLSLVSQLAPPDHWDRPGGDFGPLTARYGLDREARERANSLFRLGSKALARDELTTAAEWLGHAASAGHPGAMFRLALVALRAGADWENEAVFLIAEAARHGHGDARRLLAATARRRPPAGEPVAAPEDPAFFDEARERLGIPHDALLPEPCVGSGGPGGPGGRLTLAEAPARPDAGSRGASPGTRRPRLVLVPPTAQGPGIPEHRGPGAASGGPYLPVASGGPCPPIVLRPLPDPVPDGAAEPGGRGPWWSANALRPAVLTDIARSRPLPAPSPAHAQAAQRARDLLQRISAADGITTRTLALRCAMSITSTAWLLHWLRGQNLVETVAGVHRPGPVMALVSRPDRHGPLLEQALTALRDQLGAAVYISAYADGDVRVLASVHSPTAPPVDEWVAFRDAAHASAVGKSLLAQLDFESRMDHLARHPSIPLTERTITSTRALIDSLDGYGPHAAQFDLLEYSHREVCVAYSLGLPGRTSCVALSLPADRSHRLIHAARSLSERATGLLLAHLLTDDSGVPATDTPTSTFGSTPAER
ncbi:IclR family transcriptional regulator C-terminal domain-containing protein [Streptomyces xanthochromogenes]|uniref:IclR family transcriptional regulator domain-containing protein n=1 Tax=Streptomyces xanthochromogenes TaxID=67384 RepID=UPI0038048998